jgi:hypothetical protein
MKRIRFGLMVLGISCLVIALLGNPVKAQFYLRGWGYGHGPLLGTKFGISDLKGKGLGTYRFLEPYDPPFAQLGEAGIVWMKVSHPGYETQRLQVDLSRLGFGVTVTLGIKGCSYYLAQLDEIFPQGFRVPYKPIKGLVIVQGGPVDDLDSNLVNIHSHRKLSEFFPKGECPADLVNETIESYNQKEFMQYRGAIGELKTFGWKLLRVNHPDLEFSAPYNLTAGNVSGFRNQMACQIAFNADKDKAIQLLRNEGFQVREGHLREGKMVTLFGDPGWSFDINAKMEILAQSGLFSFLYTSLIEIFEQD